MSLRVPRAGYHIPPERPGFGRNYPVMGDGEMPKEHIYDPIRRARLGDNGETVLVSSGERRVSVAWGRDTHVQVGIGWIDPDAEKSKGGPLGWSGDYLLSGETDEQMRFWSSQWCDLDRHTINELIRFLRRARDQAFGRDE
jgi:hypothetical protein